jgi:hypothetical protein
MTVETVKARLAVIQRTITDVKRAYVHMPLTDLPEPDMPLFGNFTGPATYDWITLGSDEDLEARIYLMRLYVKKATQGIDGEAEKKCEPFFESVPRKFAARPSLGLGTAGSNLVGVQMATLLGDGGISIFNHPTGSQYIGIEWKLEVREYIQREYDDYE